jgi:hypothetical protein
MKRLRAQLQVVLVIDAPKATRIDTLVELGFTSAAVGCAAGLDALFCAAYILEDDCVVDNGGLERIPKIDTTRYVHVRCSLSRNFLFWVKQVFWTK